MKNRQRAELDEEARQRKFISGQVKQAKEREAESGRTQMAATGLQRSDPDQKVSVSLSKASSAGAADGAKKVGFQFSSSSSSSSGSGSGSGSSSGVGGKRKLSAMDQLMEEEKKRKLKDAKREEKQSRKDNWVARHLIVKVMAKKLADGKFYKKKV